MLSRADPTGGSCRPVGPAVPSRVGLSLDRVIRGAPGQAWSRRNRLLAQGMETAPELAAFMRLGVPLPPTRAARPRHPGRTITDEES